jgi:hypothetical protein
MLSKQLLDCIVGSKDDAPERWVLPLVVNSWTVFQAVAVSVRREICVKEHMPLWVRLQSAPVPHCQALSPFLVHIPCKLLSQHSALGGFFVMSYHTFLFVQIQLLKCHYHFSNSCLIKFFCRQKNV